MTTGFIVDAICLQESVDSICFAPILTFRRAAGEEIFFAAPAGFIIHAVKK